MFEYYGNIHVYFSGVGAYEPLSPIFLESLIFSPTTDFLQDFHTQFSPFKCIGGLC